MVNEIMRLIFKFNRGELTKFELKRQIETILGEDY